MVNVVLVMMEANYNTVYSLCFFVSQCRVNGYLYVIGNNRCVYKVNIIRGEATIFV